MEEDKKYTIYLSEAPKKFNFLMDEKFFESFKCKEDFSDPLFDMDFEIQKKEEDFFILNFYLRGKISLKCDLTLKKFDYLIDEKWDLELRFQAELLEDEEKVIFLPFYSKKINIAKLIYEKIFLSLPIKRIHPNLNDENFQSEELEILSKYLIK